MIQVDDFVAAVRSMVGTPVKHRGRTPGVALDCVGVLVCSLAKCGVEVDDSLRYGSASSGLETGLTQVADRLADPEQREAGDVIVAELVKQDHLIVDVGGGRIVHSRYNGTVVEKSFSRAYSIKSAWRLRVVQRG